MYCHFFNKIKLRFLIYDWNIRIINLKMCPYIILYCIVISKHILHCDANSNTLIIKLRFLAFPYNITNITKLHVTTHQYGIQISHRSKNS